MFLPLSLIFLSFDLLFGFKKKKSHTIGLVRLQCHSWSFLLFVNDIDMGTGSIFSIEFLVEIDSFYIKII